MYIGLKATTRLRREESCVVAFSVEQTGRLKYLHPLQGVLLALCDGTMPEEALPEVLASAFSVPPSQSRALVQKTLQQTDEFLESALAPIEVGRRYDPLHFVYRPAGDPDLHRLSGPIEVAWMVTYRCPFDCVYCCVPTVPATAVQPGELTTEEAYAFLEDCVRTGVENVLIHGGEPFLRDDLPDLLGYLTRHGVHFTASTKLPLKEVTVSRLATIGLSELQLSVDSADSATADLLVARPNFLRGFFHNLELLQRYGIRPKPNAVITSHNVTHIPALIRAVAERGVDTFTMSNYLRSPHKHHDSLFASRAALTKLVEEIHALREAYPEMDIQEPSTLSPRERSLCADSLSSCSGGKTGLVVGGDGNVSFCDRLIGLSEAIVGNVKSASLLEIWNGYRLEAFTAPPPDKFDGTACSTCGMHNACTKRQRCYYRVQMVDQRFYGPDYLCPRVEPPATTRFF